MIWKYLSILFIIGLTGIVSADSNYCSPPTGKIVSIDHNGNWWNITIDTSPDCFTWSDTGYGNVTGVSCVNPVPVVSFASNTTCGHAPFPVQFTDTSTNSPTSYTWNFGDGNTSNIKNPSFTYESVGNYSITHSATNTYGTSWFNITNYISVIPDYDTCTPQQAGGNNILQWIWLNH